MRTLLATANHFEPALPPGQWSTDAALVGAHRLDRSGWDPGGRPLGVAFARTVSDVQATLRAAGAAGVPVTVRGAGTGLSGGAAAPAGSVVLDLRGMDRIREISVADAVAVVEPGVITADIDRAAARYGLRYAPDPASVEISTIGGNIATNAGGLRCAKYGVTRDSVLGLDVVLADGELIHTGGRTVKGVAGYDLTSLFVGSEGTLGVIVGATLRLRPVPHTTATLSARFGSFEAAADAVNAIAEAGIVPSMAELLDGPTLNEISAAQGRPASDPTQALLIIQTDGPGAAEEANTVESVLEARAVSVTRAREPEAAAELIGARRAALPSLERLGRVLIEDIAVPRSRLADAAAGISEIAAATGTRIFTLAHAFDGNLHPIIVVEPSATEIPEPAWRAAEQIFTLALHLGGTVTGEHGIGVLKQRWLAAELGDHNHRLQQQIRRLFDPTGLLSPGTASG